LKKLIRDIRDGRRMAGRLKGEIRVIVGGGGRRKSFQGIAVTNNNLKVRGGEECATGASKKKGNYRLLEKSLRRGSSVERKNGARAMGLSTRTRLRGRLRAKTENLHGRSSKALVPGVNHEKGEEAEGGLEDSWSCEK